MLTAVSHILMVFADASERLSSTMKAGGENPTLSQEPVIKRLSSPEPGTLSQNTRDVTGPAWPL